MAKKKVDRSVQIAAMQIKKFLDGHPYTNMSTAALAVQYKVGRNALQEYFKRRYKKPLGEYKRQLRLGEAQRLLQGGKSIKEVAFALGYSSPSSFSNAFRTFYNISAREWVEQYKRNKVANS